MEAPWQRRPAVRVTRDAERWIRSGHPWVYRDSIRSAKPGRAGDLAVIFDHDRRFLAAGLWDPDSPIAVRILHRGKPATIDQRWLAAAVDRALAVRSGLHQPGVTTALRLVHGENDGLGGLVVDRYESNLVVKLYTPAWLPWLDHLVPVLIEATGCDRVVLRLSRRTGADRSAEGGVIHGPPLPGPVEFIENGLRFRADLERGHKTGHFLDQRDNRRLVADLATDRRMLDVFACTGGFTVNAAAGGARSLTSIDSSGPALALTRGNLALNDLDATSLETLVGDAFDVMGRLVGQGRHYDLIVVDPPAFAQQARQVAAAVASYTRLAELAARLTSPGGVLLQASCSTRVDEATLVDAVTSGIARAGRSGRELRRTAQPVDHPIGFVHGAYLKAVLLELQ